MPRLVLENIGPFRGRHSIELKPLTLLIGRNSTGKSLLAYLTWTLATTTPDFKTLIKVLEEKGGRQHVEELLKYLQSRRLHEAMETLERVLHIMVREAFPEALAQSLRERLPKALGRPLRLLITRSESEGVIEVAGVEEESAIIVHIGADEKLKVLMRTPEHMEALASILVSIDEQHGLLTIAGEPFKPQELVSVGDVYSLLAGLLGAVVGSIIGFFADMKYAAILVDGRAGVLRVMLRPYTALLSETNLPDQAFIAYYYMLAESLAKRGEPLPQEARRFLDELGVSLEPRLEGGAYGLYVRTWTGEMLPMPLAPSGARESATIVASLVNPGDPRLVVIEEPEAHLHPRAQVLLADLIAWAVTRNGKQVLVTTHSDYMVYEVNNLIIASARGGRGLPPETVSAYLVSRRGEGAVIEELSVGKEGIPEEEFARVAEELATRRGFLALAESSRGEG